MKTDKIYLVGFMGAGKSLIARLLAEVFGWLVIDLDRLIEELAGMTIPEIFKKYGETYFRQLEWRALLSIYEKRHVIVSCGGGTFAGVEKRHVMLNDGIVIWLSASLSVIKERLKKQADIRPLARDPVMLGKLHALRLPFYRQAHIHVNADNRWNKVLRDILLKLPKMYH